VTLTIELPDEAAAVLREDAAVQGRDAAEVAAERLAALYARVEPEAVAALAQGFADLAVGDTGMPLEEFIAERRRRRAAVSKPNG
jgi:predicted transcriptional regulator